MAISPINRINVGRIAERIVSNELEFLGFRVTDLNKEGQSANADLLAVGHGKTWQIQVKGAANAETDKHWWVGYGHCNEEIISDRKNPMFNRHESFYKADFVILVATRSPKEYCCVVLPVKLAEQAAQINMDRGYRTLKRDGGKKKPHKVWVHIDRNPNERRSSSLLDKERDILLPHKNNWDALL